MERFRTKTSPVKKYNYIHDWREKENPLKMTISIMYSNLNHKRYGSKQTVD